MKIAILGAIDSPISRDATAGTEIWTYNYVEQLIKRGHKVTLFADSKSSTSGKLVETTEFKDLIDSKTGQIVKSRFALLCIDEMVELVKKQNEFDLIHISVFSLPYVLPLTKLLTKPVFVTIHGSGFNYEDAKLVTKKYSNIHYVFISESFSRTWPKPKNYRIIHNGIDINNFPLSYSERKYYFWMSRISKEKGVEDVIEFSNKSGQDVIIAGPIRDQEYYNSQVKPFLKKKIKYVGELSLKEKVGYYQGAKAFLFPIKWPEPFGLVVVESMACGTPVVTYDLGAMKEIISNGVDGRIVKPGDIKGFISAAENTVGLGGEQCRKKVEKFFTIEKMVDNYEEYYHEIISK